MINILVNLLLHILIIISLINYTLLLFCLFKNITNKSSDIYQYKIYFFNLNYIISFTYLMIFFVLVYSWRLLNLNYELNVKHIFDNLHRLWLINLSHLSYSYQIYLLCLIFIALLLFFFIILKTHKLGLSSLFKLYLYHYHKDTKHSFKNNFHFTLSLIGNQDIITYLISKISYKLTKKFDNKRLVEKTLPWYHFDKIISFIIYKRYNLTQLLIKMSPIIVIIHDILFNNYIISHLYSYLIIYMPIMFFKQLTTRCANNANELCRLLYNLYYVKEENVLYAISMRDKHILDLFLMSDLKSDLELLDTQYYLKSAIRFLQQHPERNTWMNDKGDYITLTAEGCVFEEIEEEVKIFDIETTDGLLAFKNSKEIFATKIIYKLGIEWYLLCHKNAEGNIVTYNRDRNNY